MLYIYQIVNSSHQSFTETFITKTKVCCCLSTESSNNRNAILIIPIYTSVDHSIGAIPMAERKLCASVDGNICWVKFTKFF